MSDDLVVVAERPSSPEPPGDRPPARAGVVVLASAGVVLGVLALAAWLPSANPTTTPLESELTRPDEPVGEEGALPSTSLGWRGARLPGPGSVAGIAHGGLGWLAVVDGGQAATVFASPDAVLWSLQPIDAPGLGDPVVAVGQDVAVVAAPDPEDPPASRVLVWQGGERWDVAELEGVRVTGAAAAGGGVVVFGPDASGERVRLLRHRDGAWEEVALDGAEAIAGVVEGEGGPVAVGRTGSGLAVWPLDGGPPLEVSAPADSADWEPLDVVGGPDGGWHLLVAVPGGTRMAVRTTDLLTWEPDPAPLPEEVEGVVAGDDRLLAWGAGVPVALERSWDGWRHAPPRHRGVPTGIEDLADLRSMTSAGGVLVAGGSSDSGRPAIWIRGSSQPVALVPSPGPGQAWWRPLAAADAIPGTELTSAARRGDEVFVASTSYVWRAVPEPGGEWGVAPTLLSGADRLVEAGSELFALAPRATGDDTVVHHYHKDSVWEREHIAAQFVEAITTSADGRILASGMTSSHRTIFQRGPDGDWTEVGAPVAGAPLTEVHSVPDGFLGTDGRSWAFSPDGIDWREVDPVALAGPGFAVADAKEGASTVLVAAEEWARAVPVEIPVSGIEAVHDLENGQLVVQAGTELVIGPSQGRWRRIPTGIGDGVTGSSWIALPLPLPTVAVIDGRRLVVMGWE